MGCKSPDQPLDRRSICPEVLLPVRTSGLVGRPENAT